MPTYAGWASDFYWNSGSGHAWQKLDGVQRFSYELVNNTEAKEECGTRFPTYLVEGTYGSTGTVERFYTGSATWALFQGTGSTIDSNLTIVNFQIYPNHSGSGKPFIYIIGAKMNKIGESHKPGSNLMMETWDWIGYGNIAQYTAS